MQIGSDNNLPEETTPLDLGIKKPLLVRQPLGQRFISPKFLSPLGAKPLSNFDASVFLAPESFDYTILENSFADSPFFSEYQSQQLGKPNTSAASTPNIMQLETATSSNIQPRLERHTSISPERTFLETTVPSETIQLNQPLTAANGDLLTGIETLTSIRDRSTYNISSPTLDIASTPPINLLQSSPETKVIQTQNTELKSTDTPKNHESTVSANPNITSETVPITDRPQSTSIQSKFQSENSISTVETLSQINNVPISSQNIAIVPTNIPINTYEESTAIQAKIESVDSVSNFETLSEINNIQTSSLNNVAQNHTAIAPTTTSANTHSEPTVIQPQFESTDSVFGLEIVPEVNNLSSSEQNTAIAPTTTSANTHSEPTV
ncbi:hypothetical protein I8752_23120, partial [Nostocaceae cyanobacterium CENA369]